MGIPEAHVEKVCLRGGRACPRIIYAKDLRTGVESYACAKAHEGRPGLLESVFADEPDLIAELKRMRKSDPVEGNCSGPPSYIEYT